MGVGPVGFSVEQQNLLWAMWRRGDSIREMERTLGETLPRIRRFLRQSGGIPPVPRQRRAGHLALVEREEISRGIAAGLTARTIAGRLGRPSSTVSREIVRNGGRDAYRALAADAAAFQRARRPKVSKLAANTELAGLVAAKLDDDWSPRQIAQCPDRRGVRLSAPWLDDLMPVRCLRDVHPLVLECRPVAGRDSNGVVRVPTPSATSVPSGQVTTAASTVDTRRCDRGIAILRPAGCANARNLPEQFPLRSARPCRAATSRSGATTGCPLSAAAGRLCADRWWTRWQRSPSGPGTSKTAAPDRIGR
jgi:hypothetical protein